MRSSRAPKPRKLRVLLSRLALSVLGPIRKVLPSQNFGTQILLQEASRIPTQGAEIMEGLSHIQHHVLPKGKTCLNCKKPNHFANVCRSKKADVKQITEGSSETEEIFTLRSSKKVPTTSVFINNQNICFIINTVASVNVITEARYNNMKKKPQLKLSSIAI
ncbi:poly [ADP-ribose] polymerase [Plakobranchus ocellatus]|uniref:Poly [ADP-ribose] polymerase n=1 Tax=Plakobranchus ocellatus TaxID=259542 RepID=A0AAV3ZQ25_9GAST|nr:poly [ADP-ribose] polymerase [Plakobranchus ocellatus]